MRHPRHAFTLRFPAAPACGARAAWRKPRFRPGFTMVELLVTMAIAGSLLAVSMPVLAAIARSTRVYMGARRVEAALQHNVVIARKLVRPDFDKVEPRVPGAKYGGTALVFDEATRKAWFAINDQTALFDPSKPAGSVNTVESQDDPDQPGVKRKAYVRLKGDDIEHMDLQDSLTYFGIAWDATTGHLTLLPTPFAICASAVGGGIPQRGYVDVELALADPATNQPLYTPANGYPRGGFDDPVYPLSPSGQRRVPTALPWVLVVSRSQTPQTGWTADWDRTGSFAAFKAQIPNATGADDDSGRIQSLIRDARAELVNIAVNGGTETNL